MKSYENSESTDLEFGALSQEASAVADYSIKRTTSAKSEAAASIDLVKQYLTQISKIPLLSAAEEVELAKKIEAGVTAQAILDGKCRIKTDATIEELELLAAQGRAAMDHFCEANLRLVVYNARSRAQGSVKLSDCIQEGSLGLRHAVEKFDYTRGYKFSTYATRWIQQAIDRAIAQQSRIVRLPVHVADDVKKISNARRKLTSSLNREPEVNEIASELGIEVSKVVKLMKYSMDHLSLDAPIDDDGTTERVDLIACENVENTEDKLLREEQRKQVKKMLAKLDERSADIIIRRYGFDDESPEKLADIGKAWGITAERVRQIERAAIRTLREIDLGTAI